MTVQYIFLAVAGVMLVLNVFMMLIVKQISATVSRQIYKDASRLFSIYDKVLEEKSTQLKVKQRVEATPFIEQEPRISEKANGNFTQPFTPNIQYVDEVFANSYRTIRERFTIEKEQIVQQFAKEQKEGWGEIAKGILNTITFEAVYKLSKLQPEQQMQILAEILKGDARDMLLELAKNHQKFDVIKFYEELKQVKISQSGTIRVRTGSKTESYNSLGRGIVTEYSDLLCEGIQIVTNGQLYDYGIMKKEIG